MLAGILCMDESCLVHRINVSREPGMTLLPAAGMKIFLTSMIKSLGISGKMSFLTPLMRISRTLSTAAQPDDPASDSF